MSKPNYTEDQWRMFGCDPDAWVESVRRSYALSGLSMAIMSVLSDVQELIAMGMREEARRTLNLVKYLIGQERERAGVAWGRTTIIAADPVAQTFAICAIGHLGLPRWFTGSEDADKQWAFDPSHARRFERTEAERWIALMRDDVAPGIDLSVERVGD